MASKKIDEEFLTMLSAYMDGELTESQRQRVERRLAEDPQARAWLADFRKVSEMVGALPRESAPRTLTDQVLQEMERGILLDNREIQAHAAGRNHLLMRRIVAAAAMLFLACTVGVIIYNVLSRTPGGAESGGRGGNEPIVAISKTPPAALFEIAKAEPQDNSTPSISSEIAADRNESREETPAPLSPMPPAEAGVSVAYSPVYLILRAPAGLETESATMDGLLQYHGIDQRVRSGIDPNQCQFAFVCTAGQLRRLFESIQEKGPQRTDLIIRGFESSSQVVISPVNEEQLMAVASQSEPKQQCILALKQRWGRLVPDEKGAVPQDRALAKEQLPPWLSDLIVQAQPEMSDLRALGQIKKDISSTEQPAAAKAKEKAESAMPVISAKNAAAQPKDQPGAAGMGMAEQSISANVPAADDAQYVGVVLTIRLKPAAPLEGIQPSPAPAPPPAVKIEQGENK
jgi:hypothetical protein